MKLTLHGYWRSGASYRVRIALNLKGLSYAQVPHNLHKGGHRDPAYLTINPQGVVPTLVADADVLTQSPAILEWLEESYPTPPLLPASTADRAVVRAMAALIGYDIHPLNNLRVLAALRAGAGASEAVISDWRARWTADGFSILEEFISRHGRGFAFGRSPTLVDCYLVPQLYTARRFGVDVTPYPNILAAVETALRLPAVAAAHPNEQPDAVSPVPSD